MADPIKLEVVTDFVCPWCYLCTPRVEKLKRTFEIEVHWVFFPLHPDTPSAGLPLKDLFAGRDLDLDAMHARMKSLMDAEGLPYNRRTHTYNSRLAQELGKAFEGLHSALYKAYFVEGKNIGDVETLVHIAETAGISGEEARRILTGRTFKAAVDKDWERARAYGISGVPSFVAGGYKLVGAHPYDALAKLLMTAGAEPRSSPV